MTKKKKVCLLVGVLLVIAGLGLFGFTVVQGATGFHSRFISIGLDDDGELGLLSLHDDWEVKAPVDSLVSAVEVSSEVTPDQSSEVADSSSSLAGGGNIESSETVLPANGDIRELNLAVEYVEVKVQPGKAFGVTTRGISADQITVTNDNGAVTVSGGQQEWGRFDDYEVIVTVPSGVKLEAVQGTMDVGDVEIERLNAALIDLKVETGKVSVEETTADYAVAVCTTGEADLSGSFGTAEIEVVTGKADFEGTAGQLSISCTTGEVDVELLSSDYRVEATTGSGVIEINDQKVFDGYAAWGDQSAGNSAVITVGTGDIEVETGRH